MNDRIVSNINEVVAHTGKSRRTIFRWIKAGMPVLPDGAGYDLDQIDAWIQRRDGIAAPQQQDSIAATRKSEPGAPTINDGKDYWDCQNKKHQAKLRELEYQKRRGELIERRAVEDMLVARVHTVKAGLLTLERSLPPQLVHCKSEREMAGAIRKAIRGLLEGYAKPIKAKDLK